MSDYKRVKFEQHALRPTDSTWGAGRRMLALFSQASVIGDKEVRDTCQNVHKLHARLGELSGAVLAARTDVQTLTAKLDSAALSDDFAEIAEQLEAAKRKLAIAEEQSAAAVRAMPMLNQAYVDALQAATAWKARLSKERGEWLAEAQRLAVAALEALQRAEDNATTIGVIDNPYRSVQQSSAADNAAAPLLAEIEAQLKPKPEAAPAHHFLTPKTIR
jgi:hypothetical protein